MSRCSKCGRVETHTISPFHFSGNRAVDIVCECGHVKASIYSFSHREYYVRATCLSCCSEHVWKVAKEEFWSSPLFICRCQGSGSEVGYVWPSDALPYPGLNLEGVGKRPGSQDQMRFSSPGVMWEVLAVLHLFFSEGDVFCLCGAEEIQVQVLEDRVELVCNDCGSLCIAYAETEDDLDVIRHAEFICLVEEGFTYIDSRRSVTNRSALAKHSRRRRE